MENIKFLNLEGENYTSTIKRISENVIEICFDNKIPDHQNLLSGFNIINEYNGNSMSGDFYHTYNTLYREISDSIFQLSSDESVYIEKEECIDSDNESIEPTEEEKLEIERLNKINDINNQITSCKHKLSESDYIILKRQEIEMISDEVFKQETLVSFEKHYPNIQEIILNRIELRNNINALEIELIDLTI